MPPQKLNKNLSRTQFFHVLRSLYGPGRWFRAPMGTALSFACSDLRAPKFFSILTVTSSVGGLGTFWGPETLLFPISVTGKPKTSLFQNASILKFAPLKVVWGLFDKKEKKLYMCTFGPEPIA